MEVKPKQNPFLKIITKATLVVGLFAVTILFSTYVIGSLGQSNDVSAQVFISTPPPPPPPPDGWSATVAGSKQFDFGAANGVGISSGTDSPHLVSHTKYHSVRLGAAVDAPETSPNDFGGAGDQDGLIFNSSQDGIQYTSGPNGIYVNLWHTVGDNATDYWNYYNGSPLFPSVESHPRTRLGTLIVGHYKKTGTSYTFEYLGSSPVRWHHKPTYVPFDRILTSSTEGWLRVIYTQLDLTTACGGNFIGCQTGFTQNNLATWDGTHGSLMNIMYGYPLSNPYDVSIPPGEVEDYLYCSKSGTTKYYKPNDASFASECGSSAGTPTNGGSPTDFDGDGILNDNDPDMDGDGILNFFDPDTDGDGILNEFDPDRDGDGNPDITDYYPNGPGTVSDVDGDGIPNAEDPDMDGDGIPNAEDPDMDGDGIPNTEDPDMDGDEEDSDEPSSQIAAIYQPLCSPLVYFQVHVMHPREQKVGISVQQSLDGGQVYEKALVETVTGLNGVPLIDNEVDRQIQDVRTDVSPETVSIAIDTTGFVEETTDKFRIRVIASDDRVNSAPIDTQSFTVTFPGDCAQVLPEGDGIDPNDGDPDIDPNTDDEDPVIITDPSGDPVPAIGVDDGNGGGGSGGSSGSGGVVLTSFFNFLIENGFDPNAFTTSIARELATRIAIHILLMNEKISLADINSQSESIYPDSSVETRPGREIALATLLGVVQGYPNGDFVPGQNPTVVESYQIISELGRYMSPEIARVLEEEKVKAQGSPDWFEPYIQTFRRFNIPTGRNYFELGEKISTIKFVQLVQEIFAKVGLSDPFIRQPDLAEGIFRVN